jgi:hypothetical protein
MVFLTGNMAMLCNTLNRREVRPNVELDLNLELKTTEKATSPQLLFPDAG